MLTGNTKLYAILGDPITQALSPIVHNASFQSVNADSVFVGLRVTQSELSDAIAGVRAMGFAGLAITMPLKKAVIPLLDDIDPWAQKLDAVNVVVNRSGHLTGYNTDGAGFVEGLAHAGTCLCEKIVFLFGAGGAARSIAAALCEQQISRLFVCNIFPEEAQELLAIVGGVAQFVPFDRESAAEALRVADVVINATSLGMGDNPSPHLNFINWDALKPDAVFADVVHKPLVPPLLAQAASHGHAIVTGDQMLLYQGVLAYRLWTGTDAPIEAMAVALGNWLRSKND